VKDVGIGNAMTARGCENQEGNKDGHVTWTPDNLEACDRLCHSYLSLLNGGNQRSISPEMDVVSACSSIKFK
jgi:hypothetical protein